MKSRLSADPFSHLGFRIFGIVELGWLNSCIYVIAGIPAATGGKPSESKLGKAARIEAVIAEKRSSSLSRR
jgi:hypothetical protein